MRLTTPQSLCPICQSDNTHSFRQIYQSALNNDFSKVISESVRFKGKRDKSKFKHLMLERTSPPPKPGISSFELFIAVFGGVVGMIVGIIISDIVKAFWRIQLQILILIFAIVGYLKTLQISFRHKTLKKRILWQEKIKVWESSLICLKCGGEWQE